MPNNTKSNAARIPCGKCGGYTSLYGFFLAFGYRLWSTARIGGAEANAACGGAVASIAFV